jgi:hypothetical protein
MQSRCPGGRNPRGEKQNQPFQLSFNTSLKIDFQGSRVTSGGRLIKRARYYWLLLAESHLTRRLFGAMVRRISALPLPVG